MFNNNYNDINENYDINKNLSIQSNQKFEELSVLYEMILYIIKYNHLINIYNNYLKKELIIKESLYNYKTRLLKGKNLIEEKKI